MIKRSISEKALQYASQYPIVTLTGPRQSGKTTLTKALFPNKPYVSLEDLENRNQASVDPKGFLARYPDGAILDEIQRVPDLFSYIQTIVDQKKQEGLFILTGSQQFEMIETLTQSLAGRTAIIKLLPFSYDEIYKDSPPVDLFSLLYTGFYPRIFDKKLNPTEALSFYVSTYLERDVRKLINVKDLTLFENFLKLLAGRSGQILNTNSLGDDCGLSHNTITSWISVLEASYIIKRVAPYYRNLNKRLIKAPKIHFLDSGLLCYLLGITEPGQLITHPLRGAIFESYVVSEIYKYHYHHGIPDNIYYFRDYQGHEVDVLIERAQSIDLIEVKSSATFQESYLKGLKYFEKLYDGKINKSLIYGGKESYKYKDTKIVNWKNISSYFDTAS
ncbi:MAG: ATP-binding protein [Spirochaetia bacterium]|jgi:predicted AAA+ superfamily ATPase|nr:ATP-binding protein [Spirochaetia bacterium]